MQTDFKLFDTITDSEEVHAVSVGFRLPDFRYEEIKTKVSKILKKYDIQNIPVNIFTLAKKLGIRLVPFSELSSKEMKCLSKFGITENTAGFYALAEKKGQKVPYIYYNDTLEQGRIRFTILHEIAHIVLGHIEQSDLAEAEADFFAKYLIAPPMLVDKIKPTDYMEIKDVFMLSRTCAWNSFDYYQNWKRHHFKAGCYEEYEKRILSCCSLVVPESYRKRLSV